MDSIIACLSFPFLYFCKFGAQETNSSGKDLASHPSLEVYFLCKETCGRNQGNGIGQEQQMIPVGTRFLHPQQMGIHLEVRGINSPYKASPLVTDVGAPIGEWNQ